MSYNPLMSLEDIIRRVGRPSVDDRKVPLTATLRKSDADRIKKAAEEANVSVGALLGELAVTAFNQGL
jgi:hypothetical protein